MKPPISKTRLSDLKGKGHKVSRRKPGKVLSAAERAAFLAQRPDLQGKD